jgi:hypothetical protein
MFRFRNISATSLAVAPATATWGSLTITSFARIGSWVGVDAIRSPRMHAVQA